MRLTFDLESRAIGTRAGYPALIANRRDCVSIELQALRAGDPVELPPNASIKIGVKKIGVFTSQFLAASTPFDKVGAGRNALYSALMNFNTTGIAAAFASEPDTLSTLIEVEVVFGAIRVSSVPAILTIYNDIVRGDEGTPASLPDGKATQAEAEAGETNEKWMTPLTTAQAIAAMADSTMSIVFLQSVSDFPGQGRLDRLYFAKNDGTLWRWTGTQYRETPGSIDAGNF